MALANFYTELRTVPKARGGNSYAGHVETMTVVNAEGAVIPFGCAVQAVTGTNSVISGTKVDIFDDAADVGKILGISQLTFEQEESLNSLDDNGYADKKPFSIVTEGAIDVYVEAAITDVGPNGTEVWVRAAADGSNDKVGYAFGVATGTGLVQLTNSYWLTTTSGAGIATLYFKKN